MELPEDVAAEQTERSPFAITDVDPASASQAAIKKAAALLMQAKAPLVSIASGANRDSTHRALHQFIEQTGLYFFTTQMGKGVVDERHPRCLGTTALSDHDYIHHAIAKADVILNVGHDTSEKPPFFMVENGKQVVIHLSFFEAEMDDVYFPQHEVIGCMTANLGMLTEALGQRTETPEYFAEVKQKIDAHVFDKNSVASFPNIPQRIVSDVRQAMPDDGILSLDNGMYKIWFARNYQAYQPNTVLLDHARREKSL